MSWLEDNKYRKLFDRSCVEIDLSALKHNIREIRRVASPEADIMAVVKADAYGHGAIEVAKTLLDNGANGLCIATIGEAIHLRENGITSRLLILGGTDSAYYEDAVKYDVDLAIYDEESARILSEEAVKQGKTANIHVKLDTGMGRIGFPTDGSAVDKIVEICSLPGLIPYGVFSHFAVADTDDDQYTESQYERFTATVKAVEDKGIKYIKRHICNSAGILRFPEKHLDMVRAGLILYGLIPAGCPEGPSDIDLKPVMTWYAKVIHVKEIPEGTTVSYGRHFTASKPTKVITISVGYADGLSRRFSNGFELMVNGQRLPIIGNVCMDMCMLDATNMEGEVAKGQIVEIFGKNRSADELADYLGTISYEITCDVGKRVHRIFVDDGKPVDTN
ncbi:MAG: alanine racemase [Saccharofermentans sp.]|nr:alanine racemase [Saccharofermentans sp.]